MAVRGQMRFDFRRPARFVSESAFDRENQIAAPHMQIDELRAFHSEARNDDRPDPAFPPSSDRSTMSFSSCPGICATPSQRPAALSAAWQSARKRQKNRGE